MKYVSLFSGIEAASVAWGLLGWEPVAFAEVEPFCCSVLEARFPEVPNLGDVTKINYGKELGKHGRIDLVVGGSPCQSFSIAGKRTGLDGASGLMWEYVRAVRELMPRWVVWENVPGALSSTHGEDFGCLLRALDECGYGLAWRVLDAQFFGLAQRRERVFLIGVLGDAARACEILFEREGLRWDTPSSKDKRKALASGAGIGPKTAGWPVSAGFSYKASPSAGNIGYEPEQAPTVLAERNDAEVCIQGDIARGAHMGQNGKGWSDDGSCYTLNTMDVPAVLCMSDATSNAAIDEDMSGTITAHAEKQQPMVSDGYVVRRLTPRECERLMGMPDDWTRVPYRGKPADDCPDGPRYRAIGNSMAVPVMRWIGRRIEEADSMMERITPRDRWEAMFA